MERCYAFSASDIRAAYLMFLLSVVPRAITLRESIVQSAATVGRTTLQRCMEIASTKAMIMTMCML